MSDPVLVYDGGCLFCRHFAQLSELRSGIPGLQIRDGRADHTLRADLARRGFPLRDGAVLIDGDQVLHGAAAITWLCARMTPSAPLLALLAPLFAEASRARRLYPLLLLARRLALAVRGLPPDPQPGPPWETPPPSLRSVVPAASPCSPAYDSRTSP
jgi:predicted DCC family thiol-disulfide oxidoreductase YuxK